MFKKNEIQEIIKDLKSNKIIILPSDTIYGLSAIATKENELLINKIKASPESKKLIILVASLKQTKELIHITKEIKKNFLDKKPITQIVSLKKNPNKNIAIRMIKRKDLKKIISRTGPIFSTSVNRAGQHYLTKKEDLENFSKNIKLNWDGELNNTPSKIIDLSKNTIIRN